MKFIASKNQTLRLLTVNYRCLISYSIFGILSQRKCLLHNLRFPTVNYNDLTKSFLKFNTSVRGFANFSEKYKNSWKKKQYADQKTPKELRISTKAIETSIKDKPQSRRQLEGRQRKSTFGSCTVKQNPERGEKPSERCSRILSRGVFPLAGVYYLPVGTEERVLTGLTRSARSEKAAGTKLEGARKAKAC